MPYQFGASYDQNGDKVVRIDLSNFTSSGVTTLDLSAIDAALCQYCGGFSDGSYGYVAPLYGSTIVRFHVMAHTPAVGWSGNF